jgi:hypothetical protein
MRLTLAVGLAYAAIVVYQIYVTVAVIRFPGFQSGPKVLQVVLIWFVPLLGAIIAHVMIHLAAKRKHPG